MIITYIVTRAHAYTVIPYFDLYQKYFAHRPRIMTYDQLINRRSFQPGTYIFSDVERLSPLEAERAAQIWNLLSHAGNHVRVLNHPTQSMRRYQLLRTLYEENVNCFNVYTITEMRQPYRFPVFIRSCDDHAGPITPLLWNQSDLAVALRNLASKGVSFEDKLIIEFCDTSDASGVIRKYGAYIIGDTIVPDHIFFSRHWMVKSTPVQATVPAMFAAEEASYLATNPHEHELRTICRLAQIRYGRIDYGLRDGAVQIWEINTNPSLPLNKDPRVGGYTETLQQATALYNAALRAIDEPESGRPIPNTFRKPLWHRLARTTMVLLPARYAFGVKQTSSRWFRQQRHHP